MVDGNDPRVAPERAVPVCEPGVPGGVGEGPFGVPSCGGDRVQGSDAWGVPGPPTASPRVCHGSVLPEDMDGTGCAHSRCLTASFACALEDASEGQASLAG